MQSIFRDSFGERVQNEMIKNVVKIVILSLHSSKNPILFAKKLLNVARQQPSVAISNTGNDSTNRNKEPRHHVVEETHPIEPRSW